MSVRYIGSKARIVSSIIDLVGQPGAGDGRFVDAFCGTGVVGEAAARVGWSVHLNDHLRSAVTMARSRVISREDVPFIELGGYEEAVKRLDRSSARKGFIYREYSPASLSRAGVARMYFAEQNAARIDGVRAQIQRWSDKDQITSVERSLLIGDLLLATNRVANIAGTYGCFLSRWSPQALGDFHLQPRQLFSKRVKISETVEDVGRLQVLPNDLVYLDPPYTKRQYAAYYHVLETITVGDEPTVEGVTGLRPWQAKASDFCYRRRALQAIVQLAAQLTARRVLLSYSDQGHVELGPLSDTLSQLGRLHVVPLKEVGRYRPNRAAVASGGSVTEYLLMLEREPKAAGKVAAS